MQSTHIFRTAGIGMVVSVFVLSLIPITHNPAPGGDKLHHFIAYASCMICWAQVYKQPVARFKLAIALALTGVLIECLQDLTSYRFFEWLDMVANAVGVIIGWGLVTVQGFIERRFSRHDLERPAALKSVHGSAYESAHAPAHGSEQISP